MKPQAFSAMLSSLLYEKRFGPWFTEPIVAGLTDDDQPFISGMDLIGAPVVTSDFVVAGTCTANMHGMCESLYRPDMVRFPRLSLQSPQLVSRILRSCLKFSPSACSQQWTAMPTVAGAPSSTSCKLSTSVDWLLPNSTNSTPEGVHTRKLKCRQD